MSVAASQGMTTPGQVAGTSAIAVGFGVSMWLLVRFVIIPLGGARMASFRLGRFGRVYTNFFAWVVPGLLVVGGVVGLVVAAVGALTGMTWKTG